MNGSSQESTETEFRGEVDLSGHSTRMDPDFINPSRQSGFLEFREALPEKGSITYAHARILSTLVILEGSGLGPQ